MLLQSGKSSSVPGAELLCGETESKVLTCRVWILDLSLKSMKSDLDNLSGVVSDLCVRKSFWLHGGGTCYRSGKKFGDLALGH